MQFDERDTPATTPTASPSPSPATTTGTAWTPASPAPRRRAWSQGSPGGARASTQQPPGSQRPAEASRNQGRASRQRTKGKASAQQRRRGRKASRGAPALPSPGNRERLRPCRASAQPNIRASPTACTQGADDLERERGGEGRRERERTENHSITAPPSTCTR